MRKEFKKEGINIHISIRNQKLYYKVVFLIITLIYTTFLSYIPRFSTISNLLLLMWGVIIVYLEFKVYKTLYFKKYKYPLILFFLLGFVTIIIYGNKGSNLKLWASIWIQFFILFSEVKVDNKYQVAKEMSLICKSFIIPSLIFSAMTAIMYVLKVNMTIYGYKHGMTGYGAYLGVYAGTNTQGLVAAASIMLTLLLFGLRLLNKRMVPLYWFNIVVQLIVLYISKGRSAMVGLLVYLVIYSVVMIKSRKLRLVYIVYLLVFGLLGGFILSQGDSSLVNKNKELGFFSGRVLLWSQGVKVVKENPIYGVGVSNLVKEVKKVATNDLPGIEGGGMHNIYLQTAISNGVISLVLLVVFFLYISYLIYKWLVRYKVNNVEKKIVAAIFSITIAIYIINFVEANMLYVANFIATIYWILLGYAMSFVRKENNKEVI